MISHMDHDSDGGGDDEQQPFVGRDTSGPARSTSRIRLASTLMLFNCLSIALFSILSIRLHIYHDDSLNPELRRSHFYSEGPAYDWLDLKFHTVNINGSLFPEDERPGPRSIARQMPNKEADKVWHEWGKPRFFPLTSNDLRITGKDIETAVHLEDKYWGLGDDKYAGVMDVNHQLHCIDTLRKFAYGTYYNMSQLDPVREGKKEIHANHCIDSLVQTVQCSGNMNFITMHWYKSRPIPKPMPDMSINKQCIDFNHYTEWRLENSLSNEKYRQVFGNAESLPQGLKTRSPMAKEYLKIHGEVAETGQ
ncbi:Uu.00g062970.m01.CDS01 [Anthostomella pinea]|uniref:Uu.00g062970.m01.CDS01 n=1 Tax=Anthostomella pinea TaxID=933095 RepID=A0AAI8VT97_9PEZI|nr:Uu.00g062970.m01.CDS01 [Anthostomella pinea]